MGKKKREHIVFDQTRKPKKSIPFGLLNKECAGKRTGAPAPSQNAFGKSDPKA